MKETSLCRAASMAMRPRRPRWWPAKPGCALARLAGTLCIEAVFEV
jgi:hypothetical protein